MTANSGQSSVLVVDLDHTLIKTDLLDEAIIGYLKQSPLGFWMVLKQVIHGKHQLKGFLAERVTIRPDLLPYNQKVLSKIEEAKSAGEQVILASASPEAYVRQVAEHLNIFDAWFSTKEKNLKGLEKLRVLRSAFPNASFRYFGDSSADIPIWKELGRAHVVNGSKLTSLRLGSHKIPVETIDSSRKLTPKVIFKGLRVHQWAKNSLVFIPFLLAHRFELSTAIAALLAFVSFSLAASCIYVLNDILDLEADRSHPTKRLRPFASGAMSLRSGFLMMAGLLLLLVGTLPFLSWEFAACIIGYIVMNLLYSFRFKKVHSLDVILLASMYTIRIVAGGVATGIEVSQWLLGFSTFLFFGLAALKRYVEVAKLKSNQGAAGRGYLAEDRLMLGALGVGSSLLSCLVLALYFNSSAVLQLYSKPHILWVILPIQLYWTSHLWLMAGRGKVDADPVLYTLKDKRSYLIGLFVLLALWLAL